MNMFKKNALLFLSVFFAPLGLHRLLSQSWFGLIQLTIFYTAFTCQKSEHLIINTIGILLSLICILIYINDIYLIVTNQYKIKNWRLIYKILFFIIGLLFSLTLVTSIRMSFAIIKIDGHYILPFPGVKDVTSNTKETIKRDTNNIGTFHGFFPNN